MSRRAVIYRVGWGFADQALSSLTNFGLGVLVARTVTAEGFGVFSLAFVTYTIALITSRAVASDPFIVRHSATSDEDWKAATRGSAGIALVIGLGSAAVVALGGLVAGGPVGAAFLALAIVLPGLLVQDMWRFAFIAHGRSYLAFLVDLIWLLLLLPGLLALDAIGSDTVVLPIVVWGGAATISAVGSQFIARTVPSFRAARDWWRSQRDIGVRYAAEALVSMGATQATVFALVTFAGLATAGSLRGAQILLGPIQVVLMGIGITAVPEGIRLMHRSGLGALRKPAVAVSLLMSAAALVWGLLVSSLPDQVGVALLGETWASASALLLPMAIVVAISTLSLGAEIGLRVLADARGSLRARTVEAVSQTVGGVIGAWRFGALGSVFGLALGGVLGVVAHWSMFLASIRRAETRPPSMSAPSSDLEAIDDGTVSTLTL
jgi:O-antigen/teichoic acid export membrane protein